MLKTMLKILKYLLSLLLFILVLAFLYHQYSLNEEKKFLSSSIGQRVEVDGKKMNVYVAGKGPKTLVFLSGSGTSSPILDFKVLYSSLEKDHRIVVVEKFGYGFSDDSSTSRDLDTLLNQTRSALHQVGIEGPYVLLPHSMSGLEALHWSTVYPKEIEGIIGLDISLPEAYDNWHPNMLAYKSLQIAANIGVSRLLYAVDKNIAALTDDSLSQKEQSIYKALFYRRPLSDAVIKEAEQVKKNSLLVKQEQFRKIPSLLFVSNGQGTGFTQEKWRGISRRFAKGSGHIVLKFLNSPHYIYHDNSDDIVKEIRKFLDKID